ncbi:MAG: response regulator [Roseiflexaceae bacterium]
MEHKGPLIAVVNDEPTILDMLCELLVEEGYQVFTAGSGAEAHRLIQQALPELVILDMQMEQRDSGLLLLELLRLDPTTEPIPVIMCSADGAFLRENAAHLRAHGCTTLEKPYNLQDLLAQVQISIRPSQGRENVTGNGRHQGG